MFWCFQKNEYFWGYEYFVAILRGYHISGLYLRVTSMTVTVAVTKALIRLRERPVPLLFFEISRIHVMLKPRHPCVVLAAHLYLEINTGAPGVWGRRAILFSGSWAVLVIISGFREANS